MGIATVAIYGQGEGETAHAVACDESACIAGERAEDAYRNGPGVIEAARAAGAQAIHPGYGALASDPAFAAAVSAAGLGFVGPSPESLQRFKDAESARELARLAGVRARELDAELAAPRVLSVLLAADGNECVALGEYEHSLHRGGRPLLSESPAPILTQLGNGPQKRAALWESATALGVEGGLRGLAEIEFLVDDEGRLHFSGATLGLPARHALIEMCTDLDLVEAQFLVASGEALPATLLRAQPTGNALQADVHAELPPGAESLAIKALRWPVVAPGALRIETDLTVGHRAGTEHDSLVARVITYGQTRHQAVLTLDRVLAEASIDPLPTNLPFLREILTHESFRAGQYDSQFADRLLAELRAGWS
jgi:acetyl/propionyl-CoA carboxylase alpha subunit